MEESAIRINFMDESVTRKDHGRICNKKTKSWKNMQHEEKFMEESVTSRKNSRNNLS